RCNSCELHRETLQAAAVFLDVEISKQLSREIFAPDLNHAAARHGNQNDVLVIDTLVEQSHCCRIITRHYDFTFRLIRSSVALTCSQVFRSSLINRTWDSIPAEARLKGVRGADLRE